MYCKAEVYSPSKTSFLMCDWYINIPREEIPATSDWETYEWRLIINAQNCGTEGVLRTYHRRRGCKSWGGVNFLCLQVFVRLQAFQLFDFTDNKILLDFGSFFNLNFGLKWIIWFIFLWHFNFLVFDLILRGVILIISLFNFVNHHSNAQIFVVFWKLMNFLETREERFESIFNHVLSSVGKFLFADGWPFFAGQNNVF